MGGGGRKVRRTLGKTKYYTIYISDDAHEALPQMWNNGAKRADSLSGRVRSVHLSVSSSARLSVCPFVVMWPIRRGVLNSLWSHEDI